MLQPGIFQTLSIARLVNFGAFLVDEAAESDDDVLLPNNQLPKGLKEGDRVEVFLYRDSEDRLIATRKQPLAQLGKLAYLRVIEETPVGAFLDWGLEKDLFLPFSEQEYRVRVGKHYLVAVCLDRKDRLYATTSIEGYLRTDSPYKINDTVQGTVYLTKVDFGALVAVENQFSGFIPAQEYFFPIQVGEQLQLRVVKIHEDGRLNLSPRKPAHQQMGDDAEIILQAMEANGGFLPLHDKSHPGAIQRRLHLSKKAFKRAVGRLLKAGKIEQTEWGIRRKP